MFSDHEVMPMPIKDYRDNMKERKRDAKNKAEAGKRKLSLDLLFPFANAFVIAKCNEQF